MEPAGQRNCPITASERRFRYRAAAIIAEDGCALLAGNAAAGYRYSV